MSEVLLDGKYVSADIIDPAKHKFIGTFRSPSPVYGHGGLVPCPCGQVLQTMDASFWHWQQGHFDKPQYVTI